MTGQAVAEWVKKAEDNYLSALALSRRRKSPVPDVICNQCQQCVEKYLKALLVLHKVYFPKIHDLIQKVEIQISGPSAAFPAPASILRLTRKPSASWIFATTS